MKRVGLLLLLSISFAFGCQSEGSKDDPAPEAGQPRTSFGQAVHTSKEVSKDADARSSELERQAQELAGE